MMKESREREYYKRNSDEIRRIRVQDLSVICKVFCIKKKKRVPRVEELLTLTITAPWR